MRHLLAVGGRNRIEEVPAQQFFRLVTQHPFDRGVNKGEVSFPVGAIDDIAGMLDQLFESLLGFAQGLLGTIALRHPSQDQAEKKSADQNIEDDSCRSQRVEVAEPDHNYRYDGRSRDQQANCHLLRERRSHLADSLSLPVSACQVATRFISPHSILVPITHFTRPLIRQ